MNKKLINYKLNLEQKIDAVPTSANISASEKEIAFQVNSRIIDDLIECKNPLKHKKIFINHLSELDLSQYDTEVKEFILTSVEQTAQVVDLNISFILNQKMHGIFLAIPAYFSKKKKFHA